MNTAVTVELADFIARVAKEGLLLGFVVILWQAYSLSVKERISDLKEMNNRIWQAWQNAEWEEVVRNDPYSSKFLAQTYEK